MKNTTLGKTLGKTMKTIKNYTLATLLSATATIGSLGCKAEINGTPIEPKPQPCPSQQLEMHEHIRDHFGTLNSQNTSFLEDGIASTPAGSSTYTQRIHHGNAQITFGEDERDIIGDYLFIADNESIFTYELQFDQGLHAAHATDLIGTQLDIMGKDYEIAMAAVINDVFKISLHALDNSRDVLLLNTLNDLSDPGDVQVNGEIIEDAYVHFQGSTQQGIQLNKVWYGLHADAILGDVYIPAGQRLSQQLDEPEGLLGFDIEYGGLSSPATTRTRIDMAGLDEADLEFTNREGIFYDLPLASNETGLLTWGDDDDNLHFREGSDIERGDFIIVNNPNSNLTHVLRYVSIDATNQEVEFIDLGTGSREIAYCCGGQGTLVVGGEAYAVQVQPNNTLRMDLNGDSRYDSPGSVQIHDLNGLEITLQDGSNAKYVLFHTPADAYDGCGVGEDFGFALTAMPGNTLETNLVGGSDVTLHEDENTYIDHGMTRYGTNVILSPNGDVTIEQPQEQRQAYVRFFGGQ